MGLNSLSLDYITRVCTPAAFRNAQEYQRNGRVLNVVETANGLQANVHGSRLYEIQVNQGTGNYLVAACTCSHDNIDSFCRHVIAVLLAWHNHTSNQLTVREISQRLAQRSREELIALLVSACNQTPGLAEQLGLHQTENDSQLLKIGIELNTLETNNQASESQIIKILSPYCQEAENLYNLGSCSAARKMLFRAIKMILDSALRQPTLYKVLPANFLAACARRYVKFVVDDPSRQFQQAAILEEVNQLKNHPIAVGLTLDFSNLTLPTTIDVDVPPGNLKKPA